MRSPKSKRGAGTIFPSTWNTWQRSSGLADILLINYILLQLYNEYYQECNHNKKKLRKCSGIILAYPNFVLIYMRTQKNQLFSSATSFWLWCNQCLDENKPLFSSENAMCNEMTTIRLFSTMFQARGRSISTGPWDICGTSVEIDHWWMIVNDIVYVSCSLIQTCASLPV